MPKIDRKIVLVVLDGFGVATYSHGNAIALANPEGFNYLVANYPALTLLAAGPVVGLPWGEVGNSEVGHINMGAGRIVGQDLPRINNAIADGSFFTNEILLQAISHAKEHNSNLHLIGMVSKGGVHSSSEHLYALLGLAVEQDFDRVYIHAITDGRDTGEKDAFESIHKLQEKISSIGVGKIATIMGRFYAMDRGRHWAQIENAYRAITRGAGSAAESADDAILQNYEQNIFDEMIPPTVIVAREGDGSIHPVSVVTDNDSVVFFNFRSDRAIQLTQAFFQPELMQLEKPHNPLHNLFFVTMTEYFRELPVHIAFPPVNLKNNLAEIISKNKLTQYHIAETEKYSHVTSFFNGGVSQKLIGEERTIVQSPINDNNYVDRPEMSGIELTEKLIEKITKADFNFYIANFANADMVGHTGNVDSAIKAVQYLDRFLEKISKAVLEVNGVLLITADHGNIEELLDRKTAAINKEHSTSPVPLIVVAREFAFSKPAERNYLSLSAMVSAGIISDIAPTILEFLNIAKPREMTSVSLLPQILAQKR